MTQGPAIKPQGDSRLELPEASSTERLGADLGQALEAQSWPGLRVLGLSGPLGAGKSHLARALIRSLHLPDGSLNPEAEVPSPTYTLLQTYERQIGEVWHLDAYRLGDPDELDELGWDEGLAEAGLVLVEWPERLGARWPKSGSLWLSLAPAGEGRILTWPKGPFTPPKDWSTQCT